MAQSPFLDFLQNLSKLPSLPEDQLPKRVFIYGSDDYLRLLYARALKTSWSKYVASCLTIECDKNNISTLADDIQQEDLFAEKVFYQINTTEAQSLKIICALSAARCSHTIAINSNAKKIAEKLKKELSKSKFQTVFAASPAPFEFLSFIQQRSQAIGLGLTRDAGELIIDHYGKDLIQLENILQQLALTFPNQNKIQRQDLQNHLGFMREDDGIKLRQLILDGKKSQAICLVSDLLRRGESPLALLGLLSKHVRQSCVINNGLREGVPQQELMSSTHMHHSTFKRYTEYSRKISLHKLRKAWESCVQADLSFKTNSFREDVSLFEILNHIT